MQRKGRSRCREQVLSLREEQLASLRKGTQFAGEEGKLAMEEELPALRRGLLQEPLACAEEGVLMLQRRRVLSLWRSRLPVLRREGCSLCGGGTCTAFERGVNQPTTCLRMRSPGTKHVELRT